MNQSLFLLLAAICIPSGALAGLLELTPECEAALALSAGPAHLREQAGVYTLGAQGYEELRPSSNGFTCLVERNHEQALIPQCFDARSNEAHVALLRDEGKLIRAGMPFAEILEKRAQALADGEYPPASGPGVVYMISDYNYIQGNRGDLVWVAPHVMFHAPNLTEADIGADPAAALANPGLPIIANHGPHAFMVSFTRQASDSGAVQAACAGQLPERGNYRPFPPRSG